MGRKISSELKEMLKDVQPDGRIDVLVYLTFDEKDYEKFVYRKLEQWEKDYDIVFEDDDIEYSQLIGWHFSCSIAPMYVKRLAEDDFVKEIR